MPDMTEVPPGNDKMPVLRITGLCKSFHGVPVLKDISLDIARGETVAIIGPSGAGKTTLLRCVNFLNDYDSGSVLIRGEQIGYRQGGKRRIEDSDANISRMRRKTGMVFQRFALFPHLSVLENLIEGPVRVLRQHRGEAVARAMAVLTSVGLVDKAQAYPAWLSGGQQQRVGIARALCMEPEVLLFDEVTSALDPELVGEVLAVMRRLSEEGRTMLMVTHELRFARDVADRIVFMEQGSIIADLPARQFFEQPPSVRIEAFLASSASK
ncbi:amino acid ABC transporter ATP-binding protein [Sodalis sp. dw_96]|uniref:amino acid ABC transporter ATP-binding protein n=1 Tax=Sodalis sp. dw_96 TaxID=2719794 RepID=UPI0023E0080D|nr:amino acid ABC transporter ATP-binding protein [Sodalis sp. dw_96]